MPLPKIHPALLNSANPWATSVEDLQRLFDCENTGAITTRTSLINGFEHNDTTHQYTFLDSDTHQASPISPSDFKASLNTLGYSPIPLSGYLSMISQVIEQSTLPGETRVNKPVIVSVTGTVDEVVGCLREIQTLQTRVQNALCMEINLSCPNILGKPPPAYSEPSLAEYLRAIDLERSHQVGSKIAIGIKTPPYTYEEQFRTLIRALTGANDSRSPIDFITATNTLGSCLVLDDADGLPVLPSAAGTGIGGMAGTPLHPLALGNVRTIRSMLDQHERLRDIDIIGTGGVCDKAGYDRMRTVGAAVVGVGTALGREGVEVFGKILTDS